MVYYPFTIILALSLLLTPVVRAEVVDRVAAVVNDDIVTLSEVEEGVDDYVRSITRDESAPPEIDRDQTRRQILTRLIDEKLVRQQAKKLAITVSDREVDQTIDQILARNQIGLESLKRDLARMGKTYDAFRANITDQLLQRKLVTYEVRSKVVVTDQRLKEYYEQKYGKEDDTLGYHVLQIGISWNKEVGGEQARQDARKRAEETRQMLLDGKQGFRGLAMSYSDLPSARDGGDLGVLKREEMAPYMRDTIVILKPGEISEVMETPVGYQFFKLLSYSEGETLKLAPYEAVRDEIEETVREEEIERQYGRWVNELRDKSYIKVLL